MQTAWENYTGSIIYQSRVQSYLLPSPIRETEACSPHDDICCACLLDDDHFALANTTITIWNVKNVEICDEIIPPFDVSMMTSVGMSTLVVSSTKYFVVYNWRTNTQINSYTIPSLIRGGYTLKGFGSTYLLIEDVVSSTIEVRNAFIGSKLFHESYQHLKCCVLLPDMRLITGHYAIFYLEVHDMVLEQKIKTMGAGLGIKTVSAIRLVDREHCACVVQLFSYPCTIELWNFEHSQLVHSFEIRDCYDRVLCGRFCVAYPYIIYASDSDNELSFNLFNIAKRKTELQFHSLSGESLVTDLIMSRATGTVVCPASSGWISVLQLFRSEPPLQQVLGRQFMLAERISDVIIICKNSSV
jgi:hypothetical protein